MCTKFYPWCSVAILPQRVFKHPAAKIWATSKIYHEDKHLGAAVEFWVSRWLSWKKKWCLGCPGYAGHINPYYTPEIRSEKDMPIVGSDHFEPPQMVSVTSEFSAEDLGCIFCIDTLDSRRNRGFT